MAEDERNEARDQVGEEEDGDDSAPQLLNCAADADADVCQALMDRYGRSSAPQHRHLCASAAAMRSILHEEGLPLTPPAYFAATITALRAPTDAAAASALASFLAILLPLLPLTPPKAQDAAAILAAFLRSPLGGGTPTGTVRSVVKSLGFLLVRVDFEDWSAVQLPFETLLAFTVDRRPKVRRCAQICLLDVFKTMQSSHFIKKASNLVYAMYMNYSPSAEGVKSMELSDAPPGDTISKPESMEFLHMLNLLKLLVPILPEKVRVKVLSDSCKLLSCCFTLLTRQVIGLLEALVQHSEVESLISVSDSIIHALTSYMSFDGKNPVDTVISVSTLLKNCLNKLHDAQPTIWIQNFLLIFTSVAGHLCSDVNISKHVADILKDLINVHISRSNFLVTASQSCSFIEERTPERIAMVSICTMFDKMLSTCDGPVEHILSIISVLFLKLGDASCAFMKEIIIKLSERAIKAVDETPNMTSLQECLGTAVIAMGPEKMLSLIPISLNEENLTCSNTWFIPILKKYVVGASLQYFIYHFVPLIRSLEDACDTVKKAHARRNLQSYIHGLWDLLPSFCRYPIDTSQSFKSLAELLIVGLKENPSLHEIIITALQELVNGNRCVLRNDQDAKKSTDPTTSCMLKDFHIGSISFLPHYSKKTASRNLKALAANSMDLLLPLTTVFFDSPSEKRAFLKEAIECLASVVVSANLKKFFSLLLKKLEDMDPLAESRNSGDHIQVGDETKDAERTSENEQCEKTRCMIIELASSLVDAADEDLINLIFDYIKSCLMSTSGTCQRESYYTLSRILKKHDWFCSARIEEIMDILFSIVSTSDNTILENRLSCFHYLLVYMLKCNTENMNRRAFLILNEIILTLKSKKESRKLAYDVLLSISHDLKDSQSAQEDAHLERLFTMVMGYLSSSSPHIMSGAISALSLLIYNDAAFCLAVPNLIPSVLVLLQNKANEVIKAALGFIKVLVSSLNSNDLVKLLPDVVTAIMPWSSISKFHFRSKVAIILEILIRKCGHDAIDAVVPGKYKGFVKSVEEARQGKKSTKIVTSDAKQELADSAATDGVQRRMLRDASNSWQKNSKNSSGPYRERRKTSRKQGSKKSDTIVTADKGYRTNTKYQGDENSNFRPQLHARQTSSGKNKRKRADSKQNGGDKLKIRSGKSDKSRGNGKTSSFFPPSKSNKRR